MQSKYTGNISFYFPCKVKSKGEIERLNKRWVYWQNKKVNNIHHTHSPLTDLMDKEYNRDISENLQCALQKSLGSELTDSDNISPYALKCLQQAYRKNREDNLFAKNVQVLLSKFSISYHIKQKDCDINADGLLFLNVNPDNSIATSILVLHFKDKSAEDIIYLKHVFYKRLLVTLKEYPIESIKEMDCENCKWLDCVVCKSNNINNNVTTIQDYVNRKFDEVYTPHKLEYDVDYRARYSFIEIVGELSDLISFKKDECEKVEDCERRWKNEIVLKELYGVINADEGYHYVPLDKCFEAFGQNLSYRSNYDMFVVDLNAIIITRFLKGRKRCKHDYLQFRNGYDEHTDNIKTDPIGGMCIPGVLEEFFPSFLKAVEIHYLINKITTNEISCHERSYVYPNIFLKRLFLLWELLYELDTHKYHINQDFHRKFAITEQLDRIREEYSNILSFTMNYLMAIIAIFTMILSFVALK